MDANFRDITQQEQFSADYVIVGAGSAGCVVARRLLDCTDASVLLLEAGETDAGVPSLLNPVQWVSHIGSNYDWSYAYAPAPHTNNRSIRLPRGKVVGGSGSINALVWARGNRADYDSWADAGNSGWDYDSILPLFRKSEDWEDGASAFRGAGGPLHIERARDLHPIAAALIDAGQSYGMPYLDDINVPEPEGVGPINMNVRNGERISTSRAFLKPVLKDPELTLLTGAQVVKLNVTGSACTGLQFVRNGRLGSVRALKEVILCAGAIDTPRLLLLSGIGPADELRRLGIRPAIDLPGVGQNLQDHPLLAGLCFEAKHPLAPFNNNLEGSTFFWKSRSALRVPDLMFVAMQVPYVSPEIGARYAIPENTFCILPGLVRTQSSGYLRLITAEHNGLLEIQPNFLSEQADVDALVTAVELGLDIASQPGYRDLIRRWVVPPSRMGRQAIIDFVRQSASTYAHPVGTCAMGRHKEAVVDSSLRVHGLTGIRIADASVMPAITSANTHAPSVMIGEFAAQAIMTSLGHGAVSVLA